MLGVMLHLTFCECCSPVNCCGTYSFIVTISCLFPGRMLNPALYYNFDMFCCLLVNAFSALTLLVGQQEGHPACKKLEWRGAGVVVCLERGADLHMVQLMPLPLTASCFSKIQIGFTFLVPAHLGSPGKRAVKRVCVCVVTC